MNTDQGSQYTGANWITTLTEASIKISMPLGDFTNHLTVMDGRGRYLDNIFIERLWRSLKQEAMCTCMKLPPLDRLRRNRLTGNGRIIKQIGLIFTITGLSSTIHTALDKRTPDKAYFGDTLKYEKRHEHKTDAP